MLRESNVLIQLWALRPKNGYVFGLYSHPDYLQPRHIFYGYHNTGPIIDEARWNTMMSNTREEAECGYEEIVAQWKFLISNSQ